MRTNKSQSVHHKHFNSEQFPQCSINGTIRTDTSCNISSHNELTDTGSYIFSSCIWNACSATNGGAIYVSKSDIELTLNNCQFLSCIATSNGSGIYAQPASVVHVYHSLFSNCKAKGNGGNDGGGGMWISEVSVEVLITCTSFLSCTAKYDGGGVNMWNSNSTNGNPDTFQDCMFINCTGISNNLISSDMYCHEGGGILLWNNEYNVGIINTLLSSCTNQYGGGIRITISTDPPSEFIRFFFFHKGVSHMVCPLTHLS